MAETRDGHVPEDTGAIIDRVRNRYGRIAEGVESGCGPTTCCDTDPARNSAQRVGYDSAEIDAVPTGANLGLGCGAPIAHLELRPGETVLDLGSGGGLDAFLAAERVGPAGRVIGVDMTPQMIERARDNARSAGLSQVEFRQGRLEQLPVDDDSVDALTSNCVINLVPDKRRVFEEIRRVLRPGGRLVVSDIVLDGRLPEAVERDLVSYIGCVAGAMRREAYFEMIERAGLTRIEILKDVDFLAAASGQTPEKLSELLQRTGVSADELRGKVRSVTFRAEKGPA